MFGRVFELSNAHRRKRGTPALHYIKTREMAGSHAFSRFSQDNGRNKKQKAQEPMLQFRNVIFLKTIKTQFLKEQTVLYFLIITKID